MYPSRLCMSVYIATRLLFVDLLEFIQTLFNIHNFYYPPVALLPSFPNLILSEDEFLIKLKYCNYVFRLCSCFNFSYKTPLSERDIYRLK